MRYGRRAKRPFVVITRSSARQGFRMATGQRRPKGIASGTRALTRALRHR